MASFYWRTDTANLFPDLFLTVLITGQLIKVT